MSVLVTGATTPLGASIVHRLLADPAIERVLALGREAEVDIPEVLHDRRVTYLRTDLTRSRNVRDLMFGPVFAHEVTTVVHAALHRRASDEGRRVRRLNVATTRTLLWLTEQHPSIRRFVFLSSGQLYRRSAWSPTVLREDVELDLSPGAPQWLRDRVEADLAVTARLASPDLDVVVLRCAEILCADAGSQLHDYLASRVCLRPMGFDPMVNVLSLQDAANAFAAAVASSASGVFNVPGADTLTLSQAIAKWGRVDVALPGPLLGPLYAARRAVLGTDFRWDLNEARFRIGAVLDGARARSVLGYTPQHPLVWPVPNGGRETGI
ncbi:MAG: UDP-glucose 4-epimerase [Myxococcota bacterium]|jgi:UDP-glucose 4-epimerase